MKQIYFSAQTPVKINYPRNSLNLREMEFLFILTDRKMRIHNIIDLALCLQLELREEQTAVRCRHDHQLPCVPPCDITKGRFPECVSAHAFRKVQPEFTDLLSENRAQNLYGLFELTAVPLALTVKAILSILKYNTRVVISI